MCGEKVFSGVRTPSPPQKKSPKYATEYENNTFDGFIVLVIGNNKTSVHVGRMLSKELDHYSVTTRPLFGVSLHHWRHNIEGWP